MTGPTPNTSVRLVPDAVTAAASFLLTSRSWASGGGCQPAARRRARSAPGSTAPRGRIWLEDPGGLACGDLVRDPAGNQLAQHRVEPADDLVAGPGQITVALGPHLQHAGVAIGDRPPGGPWTAAPPPPPTGRRSGRSCSCPRPASSRTRARQLGLHIQHPLAGGDQLLGQQVPQARGRPPPPRSAPARPAPRQPASRPGPGRPGPAAYPAAPRPRRPPPRCASPYAGRSRSLQLPSVHLPILHQRLDGPWRACLIPGPALGARRLFRATPRQGPTEQAHRSKARHTAGRRFGSQPRRTSPDATSTAAPSPGGLYKADLARRP